MTKEQAVEMMNLMNRFRVLAKKNKINKISHAEFFLLVNLEKGLKKKEQNNNDTKIPGIKVSELLKEVDSSMPAISKLLRSVEQKGYVTRIQGDKDRRAVYLNITNDGKEIMEHEKLRCDMLMKHMLESIDEDEMKEFMVTLEKIYDCLKKEMEAEVNDKDN